MEMFSICEVISSHAAWDADKARAVSCIISNVFSCFKSIFFLSCSHKPSPKMEVPYTNVDIPLLASRCRGYFRCAKVSLSYKKVLLVFFLSPFASVAPLSTPGSTRKLNSLCYSPDVLQTECNATVDISCFSYCEGFLSVWNFEGFIAVIMSLFSFVIWGRVVDMEILTFRRNLPPHTQDLLKISPAGSTELWQLSSQLHGFTFLKPVPLRYIFQDVSGGVGIVQPSRFTVDKAMSVPCEVKACLHDMALQIIYWAVIVFRGLRFAKCV